MNWHRILLEIIWRWLLVVAGVATAAALFVGRSLEQILRQLLPAIFSMLPDEYRHHSSRFGNTGDASDDLGTLQTSEGIMFKLCRLILLVFVALCVYCAVLLGEIFGGAMVALVLIGGISWAAKRGQKFTAMGTARVANEDDLRSAHMLSGRGLIVGRLLDSRRPPVPRAVLRLINPRVRSADACNEFLRSILPKMQGTPPLVRLSRSVHTAIFAPTGSGKGSAFLPFLLDNPESCVAVDFGGSLANATMERRRQMGHRIGLLDPYKILTKSPDTFNPLDFIDKNSPFAIDEIRDLAESQVIRTGREADLHWNESAEVVIAATASAVVQFGDPDDKSMQTVCGLVADPQKMEMVGKVMRDSDAWQGLLAHIGDQLLHYKDKELASVASTTLRHLRYLSSPAIAASTRTSSFDPAELLSGKLTVYLVLPPEHARAQSGLLRMWISSMLRAVVRGGLQERKLVYLLLDEASSLGHLDVIDDAVDKFRGYGCRLIFGYQSLGQLKKCWPDGADQTLLSNTSQVFFAVNDLQTAEYVSNRMGAQTIVINSGGVSRGTSRQRSDRDGSTSTTSSFNANDNWQQHGRKLLMPEEVMALSPRTAITFAPGVPPLLTRLIRYYEERPDSLWQRATKGFKAVVYALALLGAAIIAAKNVAMSYQYRMNPPPVRAVQGW